MNRGFWEKLKKPFFVLAPLADVTDAAFRRIIARYGKPDVMWTEFVSADGLMLADDRGREKLMKDLIFTEVERPIVAQFFTNKPEMMRKAAELAVELGFDGVDINMGCPVKKIDSQGAGAALIKAPELACELIAEAKKGAEELPVSLKTRLGYNKNELETWLPALLTAEPVAITIHARTKKEMSKVPAHWDQIKRAGEIRDEIGSETLIIGNGDVMSLKEARQKVKETGADGIMLGKAIFGNPWLFSSSAELENSQGGESYDISYEISHERVKERLEVLVEHTRLFEELLGDTKNFAIMKKHYKAYVTGWEGSKELRMKLMEAENAVEVESIIREHLGNVISVVGSR